MSKARDGVLIELQRGSREPLKLQLERGLRDAIRTGRLDCGSLLPSSRALAAELGVSRGLVVEAFEQLQTEGYVCSRPGSSTCVAYRHANEREEPAKSEALEKVRYDFRPGRPDLSLFPRRAWLSAVRRALAHAPPAALDYGDVRGAFPARAALSAYLNRARATVADPGRMLLCTGFAQGMRLVCEVLRARGVKRIAVEDPGHAYESDDVKASGLELAPARVDNEGLCVERLAKLNAGAVYVTPAHQYPTGAVLSPARRTALLAWAEQKDAFVIEDDYDGEYRYDRGPVGALQGLGPQRTIYIGSASKSLAPALRMAWVLAPACLLQDLIRAKLCADRGSPGIDQLALAEFIGQGHLDRSLRRTRAVYRDRRAALAAALQVHLPGHAIRGVAAGLHLALELPRGSDETEIVRLAADRGILVHGLNMYRSRPNTGPPTLLLGYCRLSENNVAQAAKALGAIMRGRL